jgi:putative flippase GtrA
VGLLSTAVNLATLGGLIEWLQWSREAANIPSMLLGSAVQFVGHRHFVFRAKGGKLSRQGSLFLAGEGVGLVLNLLGFWVAAQVSAMHYTVLRLVVSFVVFVFFNYPFWKWVVFKKAE